MFGPLIAKPGSSKKNKTGSWRAGKKPKFIKEKCIGCGLCILFCPEPCLKKGEEKNTIICDYDYCKGCGLCAKVCPKQAIIMVDEGEKL